MNALVSLAVLLAYAGTVLGSYGASTTEAAYTTTAAATTAAATTTIPSTTTSSTTKSYTTGSGTKAYGNNFFVDSQNTYYDGYQQAWRYLGWYVKCGAPSDRYEDSHESEHSHGGSHNSDENRWQGNNYCQRFLIWAMVSGEG